MTEEVKTIALTQARNLLNSILPKDIPDDFLALGFAGAIKAAENNPTAVLATLAAALEICRRFGGGEVFAKEAANENPSITITE